MEQKDIKAIIIELTPTELAMINRYRTVKKYLYPGNIIFHFDENHILRGWKAHGGGKEKENDLQKNTLNSVDNPKI